jgi:sugar phosphate isomerase/epimerase
MEIAMHTPTRREFLQAATLAGLAGYASAWPSSGLAAPAEKKRQMQFGLVTYLWGADWDLPTLISHCEQANVPGVELRTMHAHGVEPSLSPQQRAEVKKRFADSKVTNVGIGSNERFDDPNPAAVQKAIEDSKAFIRLSQDVGGSGVKVKPDRFHKDVPREQTIEQIGRSLNVLGKFGADYHQQIRLEVHGQCAELPTIRKILDVADHPNVAICWNSNPQDLQGDGLEKNFQLVADRFGATCHIHELEAESYPYIQLFTLLQGIDYKGWVLLEAGKPPQDRLAALKTQRRLFDDLLTATAAAKSK